MIEAALQYKNGALYPYSKEDQTKIKEYDGKHVIKAKLSGVRNPRSYQQLKMYFACCRAVAENTNNPNFNTANKVDLQLRVLHGWLEDTIIIKDKPQFITKSISFKAMKHLEACNYFDRAFETMAKFLGCTIEELKENAE